MGADAFIDTNILLYAVSSDPEEADKARRARQILAHEDFGVSAQVLQEFFVNSTHKIKVPLSDREALEFIRIVSQAPVVPTDTRLVVEAVGVRARFGLSYWDAAIVAAAHALGAVVLYTEDLNDGQDYGGVRAENPFRG
jgi:predicted nucleic acid-binding protein